MYSARPIFTTAASGSCPDESHQWVPNFATSIYVSSV